MNESTYLKSCCFFLACALVYVLVRHCNNNSTCSCSNVVCSLDKSSSFESRNDPGGNSRITAAEGVKIYSDLSRDKEESQSDDGPTSMLTTEILRKRNELSRALNRLQEQLGQLQCANEDAVTNSGGWCIQNRTGTEDHHRGFDKYLLAGMSSFFRGKSVASFGAGPGLYCRGLLSLGEVKSCDAYDGAPFSFKKSNGSVQFLDLTLDQYGLPGFDWIYSLEVIEHIPAKYEKTALSNIVRHAREGIILSWARENQGGHGHVNCRNINYVIQAMAEVGFERDEAASKDISSKAVISWLAQNTNVYRRKRDFPFLERDL